MSVKYRARRCGGAVDQGWFGGSVALVSMVGAEVPVECVVVAGQVPVVEPHADLNDSRVIGTTGYQLNAIAPKLVEAGATTVSGVVLARTPWTN